MDYLVKNIFTETAGARKSFPKVAMIITDGKSQDPVEEYAKRLRNIGVEIFVLGVFYCFVFHLPCNNSVIRSLGLFFVHIQPLLTTRLDCEISFLSCFGRGFH